MAKTSYILGVCTGTEFRYFQSLRADTEHSVEAFASRRKLFIKETNFTTGAQGPGAMLSIF